MNAITEKPRAGSAAWMQYAALMWGLAITAVATAYVYRSQSQAEEVRFRHTIEAARSEVANHLDTYIQVLRSASGLFAASEEVTRDDWSAYAEHLELTRLSPGVRGIGFSRRIPPGEEQAVLDELQSQVGAGINLWPEHGAERHAIIYLEPLDARNLVALGYDMSTESVRRSAMARACDGAAPAASGRVRLVQELNESKSQAGFLIYCPVYQFGVVPPTVAERRNKLIGFVYSPYRMDDLMFGIFRHPVRATVRFNIYEGTTKTADHQMYRSSEVLDYVPDFHRDVTLQFAGMTWTIEFFSLPNFNAEGARDLTPFVAVAGGVLTLLLFAALRSQAQARLGAESIAGELRQREQALTMSEARSRRLAESNLIGVVSCDINGTITGANQEFFRLIGRDREEVLSGHVRMDALTPPEFRGADAVAMAQLRARGVADTYEKELLRPSGERVPVLFGIAMVEQSTSECVGFCIDLSESKQSAAELQRAKEQAEAANRAKDNFLAILSHELRTPLTPVLAVATAAHGDNELPEQARADFAMIRRNIELEARLIDDLLDLTSLARGKIRLQLDNVDLHQIVRHALDVCSSEEAAMKHLTVQVDLRATSHHVRGDPARLQQVFWNLLRNAVKFTPAGGTITVFSRNDEPAREILIGVRDTGVGIEPRAIPKVFDAFEQGDAALSRKLGGLGLGLAISKGLVAAHVGRISAESSGLGQGATFTVALGTIAATAPAAPVPQAGHGPGSRLLILLVEDHADTAQALTRLLRGCGYDVRAADGVQSALNLAVQCDFDVLVSDLGLPDGSGLELMRQIREQANGRPQPRGIALTGFGMEEDIAKSREAGFTEHITKPVNFQNLQKAIERVTAGP